VKTARRAKRAKNRPITRETTYGIRPGDRRIGDRLDLHRREPLYSGPWYGWASPIAIGDA